MRTSELALLLVGLVGAASGVWHAAAPVSERLTLSLPSEPLKQFAHTPVVARPAPPAYVPDSLPAPGAALVPPPPVTQPVEAPITPIPQQPQIAPVPAPAPLASVPQPRRPTHNTRDDELLRKANKTLDAALKGL